MAEPDATILHPVAKDHQTVQIALGRGGGIPSGDVDYAYTSDTVDPPWIMVPFVGNFNAHQPLANVGGDGHFTSGLTLNSQLYSFNGHAFITLKGGGPPNPSNVKADAATNIVSWSWPFDPAHTALDTPSLIYNANPAADGAANQPSLTAFYFQFLLPVKSPTKPVLEFVVCSTDWAQSGGPTSTNCKQIPPLQFWWHCLAEGTEVTLADGSTRKIEDVDNQCRVRTGHGSGTLGVEATTRGAHHTANPDDPATLAYELRTSEGRTLVLTGGHPVFTEDGFLRACDLAEGSSVITESGVDTVSSLKVVDTDCLWSNLNLIDEKDRANGLAGTVGSFVANGIVVGDHSCLEQVHYNNTHSLEYMHARIPERYHQDYASTLAAIARDNVRYGGRY